MALTLRKSALIIISALTTVACMSSTDKKSEQTTSTAAPGITVIVDQENDQLSQPVPETEPLEVLQEEIAQLSTAPVIPKRAQKAGTFADTASISEEPYWQPQTPQNRENYAAFDDSPIKQVNEAPVSTFSIDVDTGSYANVRRFLNQGQWPQANAVRSEELINYFSYNYPEPTSLKQPFSVATEIAKTPWNKHTHLLHIGIRGYQKPAAQLPASNLVFLVDVSGSMNAPNKIGLLKSALQMLTRQMTAQDRIAIAVYAGAAGTVLEPTAGDQHAKIDAALQRLSAGGSTNGAAGIQLAYQLARQSFIDGGVNRVILATDGDFNVGISDVDTLKDAIKQQRESGIALTTLGFGSGNYNDHLMEQLANVGNGNYAYIDTLKEAQKVLVDERASTLLTIAKDVKIQIEFNPAQVAEYRLIGYENRALKREDFNNDKVDAGDIGAGHSVTALYEITLQDSAAKSVDTLRYGEQTTTSKKSNELAFLRLRYKQPNASTSQLIEKVIAKKSIIDSVDSTSDNFRFAAAVAAFSQSLRGSHYLQNFNYRDIRKLASHARGADPFGYRGEFLQLIGLAESLNPHRQKTVQNHAEDSNG